jgi:hypothetical protein
MKPIGIIVRTKIENVEFFSENPVVEIVDFFPQHRGLPQLGINLNKVSRQAAQTVRSYSRILGGRLTGPKIVSGSKLAGQERP